MGIRLLLFLSVCMLFGACKEPFTPKVTNINSNLLVVEGFVNISDSTFIKLSRTVILAENKITTNPEIGAMVLIESDNNQTYPLKEESSGLYKAPVMNLNKNSKYRIKIKTAKGVNYASDFVEAKVAPAIDNVGFEAKSNGLQVHVSTRDVSNQSIYYRWEFEESWRFNAKFNSLLIFNQSFQRLIGRQPTIENIYECWSSSKSTTIVLGSSIKLNQDVISQSPVVLIPAESEKIGIAYSVLVKQYVLTKEAYEFWENLKKNTESLGSIFDAQPSQLTGNVHNLDDSTEPVIGYIGAGTVQSKRVFITKSELPSVWKVKYPYDCIPTVVPEKNVINAFSDGKVIPIDFDPNGVLAASRECADCTIRGSNKKPSFWP